MRGEHTMGGNDHVCTPKYIWRPLVEWFGNSWGQFGLDPCSNHGATVPAVRRIVLANVNPGAALPDGVLPADGLARDWSGYGVVFVNPPWSRLKTKQGRRWITKCADEADEAILLTKAAVSTQWFQDGLVPQARAVTCYRGRVTFQGSRDPAPFPVALSYFGDRLDLWMETVARWGWTTCLKP